MTVKSSYAGDNPVKKSKGSKKVENPVKGGKKAPVKSSYSGENPVKKSSGKGGKSGY